MRKAPVKSVPWVHIPFDKVAIDLIGPLHHVTNCGKRYILTVVDYATRYTEAVPLENIDNESIAEALIGIFSRVGFPREILSDNGIQFVSQVMKKVTILISLKQLFSSPYHPMANGLCEKFNGTLKKVLICMSNAQPKEWDRFIEPLLSAYREVPQEAWLASRCLLLNEAKTEAILFAAPNNRIPQPPHLCFDVCGCNIIASSNIRDLGVQLDSSRQCLWPHT